MKFKKGDKVRISYSRADGEIGIVVEFSHYNKYHHECYWIKRINNIKWIFENKDSNSRRNNGFEQSFVEDYLTLIGHVKSMQVYGIVKFLETRNDKI